MTDTNQLPEPELGYTQTDKSNQPAFSARQMREAMKHALQARAQVQGEPVAWEWRHLITNPDTVDFGKWSEWKRVEARSPIFTAEDERRYIADGYKYELRALYTTPQPAQATQAASAEDMKVYDSIADRYFREAPQAEVTDGIRPEDFTVDVVVKPMGGFAPVNTQGVRVTHKPTGISVTCDAARSQHTNRHQALEKLSAILATPTAQAHPAEVTEEQILEIAEPFGEFQYGDAQGDKRIDFARAILALRPAVEPMTREQMIAAVRPLCSAETHAEKLVDLSMDEYRAIEAHHGITAQAEKETP